MMSQLPNSIYAQPKPADRYSSLQSQNQQNPPFVEFSSISQQKNQ